MMAVKESNRESMRVYDGGKESARESMRVHDGG